MTIINIALGIILAVGILVVGVGLGAVLLDKIMTNMFFKR